MTSIEHEQERLGLTGSLQWQVTDKTLVSLDALYAKFEAERSEIFLEAPVFSANGAANIRQRHRARRRHRFEQQHRLRRVRQRRHSFRGALR